MRVAFVGKGGAGKTTIASLFARFLAELKRPVLCLDADINQNLSEALGLSDAATSRLPELGNESEQLKEILRGTNPRIRSASTMLKTTPPGTGSRLLKLETDDDVWSRFSTTVDGVKFMRTGGFKDEEIGTHCYHSKTGAVELLLNHLVDGPEQYVVVDMTAGADSFASGLFSKFDLTVVVVEPTIRAVGVFEQYVRYAAPFDVRIVALGNKISCEGDEIFLRNRVGDRYLGAFRTSDFVKRREQNSARSISATRFLSELEPENLVMLKALKAELDGCTRDTDRLRVQTIEFHTKNCVSWANALYGEDLRSQIDPDFRFSN
jgi:CO dehydrogenase maturation factor